MKTTNEKLLEYQEKIKKSLAPMGFYDCDFLKAVLDMYIRGYSLEQLHFYFEIDPIEIEHILDMHLEMYMEIGSLKYGNKNE